MKDTEITAERRRLMANPAWLEVKGIGPLTFMMPARERVMLMLELRLAMSAPVNTGPFGALAIGFEARMHDRLLGERASLGMERVALAPFKLSAMEALMFLAQLQLALTHPVNRRPSTVADVARSFGRKIQEQLSINATISRICELGWEVADEETFRREYRNEPVRKQSSDRDRPA